LMLHAVMLFIWRCHMQRSLYPSTTAITAIRACIPTAILYYNMLFYTVLYYTMLWYAMLNDTI
jgi:hypothetical protein